jgi:hypothetical protein
MDALAVTTTLFPAAYHDDAMNRRYTAAPVHVIDAPAVEYVLILLFGRVI